MPEFLKKYIPLIEPKAAPLGKGASFFEEAIGLVLTGLTGLLVVWWVLFMVWLEPVHCIPVIVHASTDCIGWYY